MTGYRTREIGGLVRKALTTLPVVAVTGLRQAGKSTFLQNEPGLTGREQGITPPHSGDRVRSDSGH